MGINGLCKGILYIIEGSALIKCVLANGLLTAGGGTLFSSSSWCCTYCTSPDPGPFQVNLGVCIIGSWIGGLGGLGGGGGGGVKFCLSGIGGGGRWKGSLVFCLGGTGGKLRTTLKSSCRSTGEGGLGGGLVGIVGLLLFKVDVCIIGSSV